MPFQKTAEAEIMGTEKQLNLVDIDSEAFRKLPECPGVYTFWQEGTPIYIGKASNLRARLTSYLASNLLPKTRNMVATARGVTFVLVNSELEALLLEAYQIRKFQPHYNFASRDDKHPLYIKITREEYPRVLTARKIVEFEKNLAFYGPFPSSAAVKSTLRMLRKIFPFADHKIGNKPCLYSHMGLCNPCPNEIEAASDLEHKTALRKKYFNNIRLLRMVLNRKLPAVKNALKNKMHEFALGQDFENASQVRDQLQRLEYITQPRMNIEEFLHNPNLLKDIRDRETEELTSQLSEYFTFSKHISRIECYDVAHLSGVSPAASMVTFIDGEPEKSYYRHFRINSTKIGDDLASLHEVIARRKKYFDAWGRPDLIVVDGGPNQVGVFTQILKKTGIPVVGLAKREETLVIPVLKNQKTVYVQIQLKTGSVLNLLQRLRNEAHRFAQRYHHKLLRDKLLRV